MTSTRRCRWSVDLLDPLSIAKILRFSIQRTFTGRTTGRSTASRSPVCRGEPIDNVTLALSWQTMGLLDRVGGRAQLASMQGAVPTAATSSTTAVSSREGVQAAG